MNRGKWVCPSQLRALSPGQKCNAVAARECLVHMCKSWPTSRRMDQAHCGPFSNRGCSYRTSIWVPGEAILQFGLSGIGKCYGYGQFETFVRSTVN